MAWKWSANGLQMEKLGVTNRIRTTWIDGGRQMVFTQLWIDSLFGFNSNYGTSTNQANSWTNPCSSFIGSLLFDCQSPQNVGFVYTNFVWCTPLSISSLIYIRWNLILSPLCLVLYHLVISVLDNWWYYGSNSILVGSSLDPADAERSILRWNPRRNAPSISMLSMVVSWGITIYRSWITTKLVI